MLSRFLVASMAFIMFINMSMAASHSGVKEAFDEFNYVMNVEGAVMDPERSREALMELQNQLQGADRNEVMEVALAGIPDKKMADEIRYAVSTIETQKLSNQEASQLMTDIISRGSQRGASWNGFTQFLGGVAIVAGMMLFMFGLMYVVTRSSDCPTNYNEEQCKQWDENVKW